MSLLLSKNLKNTLLYFENNNWKIVKKDRNNSANRVVPHKNKIRNEVQYWSVIENDRDGFTDSQVQQLSNQVLYVSPFFRTQNGEEVGLSHIFYVKLKKAEGIEILEEFEKENNVEIVGNNKFMPMWYTLVSTKNSKGNALEMANLFYESGQFSSAEPDLMTDILIQCTDDDYFPDQWNLTNTGQHGGTCGIDVKFCEAWELASGCDDIVVAVIDHGFELNHPDLANISALSYDASTGTSPSQVRGSHGTACAGIIGATADNGQGVAGVASGCQLMSISHSLTLTINAREELALRRGRGRLSSYIPA